MPFTLADLITATRDTLNEAAAGFFTDAELTRYLNQAALDVSSVAKCVEATTLIALGLGDYIYPSPADSVEVLHIQEDATQKGLTKISPSMAGHHSGTSTGDEPLRWYEWNEEIYIEPIPNATAVGKNIRLFYARATTDVTLLPDACQHLCIDYATSRALLRDRRYADAAQLHAVYINSLAFRRVDIYQRASHTVQDLRLSDRAESR